VLQFPVPTASQLVQGMRVRVIVSQGVMQGKGWRSRAIEGTVLAVRHSAVFIEGTAATWSAKNCHRCGRAITREESVWTGFGPDCCEILGIDWGCPETQRDAVRASVRTWWEGKTWIPRWGGTKITILDEAPVNGALVGVPIKPLPDARLTVEDLQTSKTHGERIVCRSQFRYADGLRSLKLGKWDPEVPPWPDEGDKRGAWTFAAEPHVAYQLRKLFSHPGLIVRGNSAFAAVLKEYEQVLATREQAATFKVAEELPDIPNMKHAAWRHQRQAYWFASPLKATMLSMDMGTGKSFVTVALIMNRNHAKTLILAPKKVVETVWHKQFTEHAGRPYMLISLVNGGTSADKARYAKTKMRQAEQANVPFICVVNYETARMPDFADWSLQAGFDLVVYDESHKIKAPDGAAAKYCGRLAKAIPWKLSLTGTPMPHSPLDVWSQYRALDTTIFGTSFIAFKQRYAIMGGWQGKQVVGWQRQDELNEKFYSIAYRVTSDVLDLPPVTHEVLSCKLSKVAAEIYSDLEDDFISEVEEGVVTAKNALSKLLRLQQVTSGYIKLDENGLERQIDTSKQEMLDELVDSTGAQEPLVVFTRFRHDLDVVRNVAEKNGRRYAELSGRKLPDVPDLQSWQNGEADIIGVQIQAGGAGIDLTRARYCVYYSLGFSLGDYEQSLARVHRPGQTRATTYYHLVAEGTVDQKVYSALSERKSVVEHVLTLISGAEA
jgi:SNF2 family DNA or RNA helicase